MLEFKKHRLPNSFVGLIVAGSVLPGLLHFFGVNFGFDQIEGIGYLLNSNNPVEQLHKLQGGIYLHTILETFAIGTAAIIFILSHVSYRANKNADEAIVGTVFLFAAILDLLHLLGSNYLIDFVSHEKEFMSFSWAVGRIAQSVLLIVALGFISIKSKQKDPNQNDPRLSQSHFSMALIAAFFIFYLLTIESIPKTIFQGALVVRPWDLYPLVFYGILAIAFYLNYKTEKTAFNHSLLIMILPNSIAQIHMAFGSSNYYDSHFNIAHFLKIGGYGVFLVALFYQFYLTLTQQKESEIKAEALHTKELEKTKILETILSNISEGVMVYNKMGRLTFQNKSFEKFNILELPKTLSLSTANPIKLYYPDKVTPVALPDRPGIKAFNGEYITNREFYVKSDSSGKGFNVIINALPLKIDSNQQGVVIVYKNITTEKQQNDRLSSARDNAIKTAQAKSNFLATISHEIRNPLNGITGVVQLLQQTNMDEKQLRHLHIIENCCNTILNIIGDVLDYSKLEAGKLALDETPMDLNQNIKEISQLMSAKASQNGNLLTFKESSETWIMADTTRIRQILLNLIGNAIKFTQQGVVTVSLNTKKLKNEKVEVLISVQDTGIGMSKTQQKRIFDSFTQANEKITREHGGTGLGLSICKKIIEIMGGRIWVNSQPNKGSEFFVSFVTKITSAQTKKPAAHIETNAAKNYDAKVLVVDDNPINVEVFIELLKQIGIHADSASNGKQAVEVCKNKKYDLIYMDYHMPEMDGIEAAKEILKDNESPPTIVAVTASVMQEDREKCYKAGMSDFISKPVNINSIKRTLQSFPLSQDSGRTEATSEYKPNLNLNKKAAVESSASLSAANLDRIPSEGINALIDYVQLYDHFDQDFKLIQKFSSRLLDTLPGQIKTLQEAYDRLDFAKIHATAHSIKGVLSNFHVAPMVAALSIIESNAKRQLIHNTEEQMLLVKKMEIELYKELRQLLKKAA